MPTIIRDFLPDRFPREKLSCFAKLWVTAEEFAALDHDLSEHLATPAELGRRAGLAAPTPTAAD